MSGFSENSPFTIITLGNILNTLQSKNTRIESYKIAAAKLSKVIKKEPPWTWRYIESIYYGTLIASKKFEQALSLYGKKKPSTLTPHERRIKRKVAQMAMDTRQAIFYGGERKPG